METLNIIAALGALAQESRLAIFRLLVETGPEGLPVGQIAEKLGLANATLSFHLKELANAELVVAAPNGRSIICSANFNTMNEVIGYLGENCCAGASCSSVVNCKPAVSRKTKPVAAVSKPKRRTA